MALELYPHQAQASQAVERMLADRGRAAVILPTGTGKSYIAFRVVEQHPEATFLWLASSEYIFRTQTESLHRTNPELSLENVTFCTYASLIYKTPEELAALACDYIILDEFHRCGSEHWGAAVQLLLDSPKRSKLLGLSATHIRYLDHQRNMAEELPDNCIAAEMTLGEAIVRGILPAPKYVTTVYQYQKSLTRYEKRVASQRNRRCREGSERYLQALRRALEQAEGLDIVFARHMTDRLSRYVVFCAGVEHMRDMLSHAGEWFHAVDPQPHCYQVYAENAEASGAYNAFRQDESDPLKLLCCVNMLNGGMHMEGISGMIPFRPTVSPIICKQQTGCTLTGQQALRLEALGIVRADGMADGCPLGQGISNLRTRYRGRQDEEKTGATLDQILRLDSIGMARNTHETRWDMYFAAAERYYREHGDRLAPRGYQTKDRLKPGVWVVNQRATQRKKEGTYFAMSDQRIQMLSNIGMQ